MRDLRYAFSALLLLGIAQPARAGLHPSIVDQPRGIVLVGHAATPDPAGLVTFRVVDRWIGVPLEGLPVDIDFTGCGDVRIYAAPAADGVTLYCPGNRAVALTDAQGLARFIVVGGGFGAAAISAACAAIHVAGHSFPPLVVSAFDLDGVNGVGAGDLRIWGADFASGQYRSRSDYNFDGIVGAADLVIWGKVFAAGGSTSSGVTSCGP